MHRAPERERRKSAWMFGPLLRTCSFDGTDSLGGDMTKFIASAGHGRLGRHPLALALAAALMLARTLQSGNAGNSSRLLATAVTRVRASPLGSGLRGSGALRERHRRVADRPAGTIVVDNCDGQRFRQPARRGRRRGQRRRHRSLATDLQHDHARQRRNRHHRRRSRTRRPRRQRADDRRGVPRPRVLSPRRRDVRHQRLDGDAWHVLRRPLLPRARRLRVLERQRRCVRSRSFPAAA